MILAPGVCRVLFGMCTFPIFSEAGVRENPANSPVIAPLFADVFLCIYR